MEGQPIVAAASQENVAGAKGARNRGVEQIIERLPGEVARGRIRAKILDDAEQLREFDRKQTAALAQNGTADRNRARFSGEVAKNLRLEPLNAGES
jgi:hypothetical protein